MLWSCEKSPLSTSFVFASAELEWRPCIHRPVNQLVTLLSVYCFPLMRVSWEPIATRWLGTRSCFYACFFFSSKLSLWSYAIAVLFSLACLSARLCPRRPAFVCDCSCACVERRMCSVLACHLLSNNCVKKLMQHFDILQNLLSAPCTSGNVA